MIPYFVVQNISIGPITLHVWGVMVALGFLTGAYAAVWLSHRHQLDSKIIWDSTTWIIVGALIGARLFHVLFYEPTNFLAHPEEIIAIWNGGLSITGGLIGAVLIGIWVLKQRNVDVFAYADVLAFGLPIGTFVGRIGCFLMHLHPGKPTNFVLGVLYPDGIVRHDLGLYLSLNGLVLFLIFLMLSKRKPPIGSFLVGYFLWYGATRFFLDFLRATEGTIVDTRYLGLTPAQYVSILLLFLGLFGLWRLKNPSPKSYAKF